MFYQYVVAHTAVPSPPIRPVLPVVHYKEQHKNIFERRRSSIQRFNTSTLPDNLKRNYEKFQKNDGIPIHLKGGIADMVLYRATMGLCVIGIMSMAHLFIGMAFPKKNK